jgi:hypothetical protein
MAAKKSTTKARARKAPAKAKATTKKGGMGRTG